MKNQTKAWNISKTHWKQSQLEVAVSAAFEYVQESRPKKSVRKVTGTAPRHRQDSDNLKNTLDHFGGQKG